MQSTQNIHKHRTQNYHTYRILPPPNSLSTFRPNPAFSPPSFKSFVSSFYPTSFPLLFPPPPLSLYYLLLLSLPFANTSYPSHDPFLSHQTDPLSISILPAPPSFSLFLLPSFYLPKNSCPSSPFTLPFSLSLFQTLLLPHVLAFLFLIPSLHLVAFSALLPHILYHSLTLYAIHLLKFYPPAPSFPPLSRLLLIYSVPTFCLPPFHFRPSPLFLPCCFNQHPFFLSSCLFPHFHPSSLLFPLLLDTTPAPPILLPSSSPYGFPHSPSTLPLYFLA